MQILPVDRNWLHTYVLEPYLQGSQLINMAWSGFDSTLEQKPLSWKERSIYWLQGSLLLCPMINTIVWLAWQTFGTPEKLAESFCVEIDATTPPPLMPQQLLQAIEGREVKQFGFNETIGNKKLSTNWLLEIFEERVVATQNSTEFSSSSIYTHDFQLTEYHYLQGEKKYDMTKLGSQIHVKINGEKKTFDLPKDATWIQQRALGLKPFVLSEETQLEFYVVIPEYPPVLNWWTRLLGASPCLEKGVAVKKEIIGGLLKVEVKSAKNYWPYSTVISELWFDPETSMVKRFSDEAIFLPKKTGVYRD